MAPFVSDDANKYVEADDEKIIISHSNSELQGLMEERMNVKNVSNGDDINNRRNIAAPLQHRAGGRSVRRLKIVISAKELCELLNSDGAAHDSRRAAFASLVLEKLSVKGEISCRNGGVVMRNSRPSCTSTRSVQGKGNYKINCHSWRPSLEDIPENFTEIE
jgi:hypothetical protein